MTKIEIAVIENIVNEAFGKYRSNVCEPHERRITESEKRLVRVFDNGLQDDVKETKAEVKRLKWIMSISIVISVFATYLLDKFLI